MVEISDCKGIINKIIGAAMEVRSTIGSRLQGPIYNECPAIEPEGKVIYAERVNELSCYYKGCKLRKKISNGSTGKWECLLGIKIGESYPSRT